jgi:hypothetical protein
MENFIYFNEEEIRDYLRAFGAGRDSHDYELSEAVRLMRFYDAQLKRPHLIGIPVSADATKQVQSGTITKNEAIRDARKEDTDVDVLIIDAEDSHATPRDTFRGDVFQIKRFLDNHFDGDFTSSTIATLKKILEKNYGPSPYLSLYLAINLSPQAHTPNWQSVADFLAQESVPFVRVILGPIRNEKDEELLVELFPKLRFLKI